MSKAYLVLHKEVSAALYEADPLGVAVHDAPLDEYDTEAARLIAAARDLSGDMRGAVNSMFPRSSQKVVERIERAWREYEAKR